MAEYIGECVLFFGGLVMLLSIILLMFWILLSAWIAVSNKFRGVCRAESLIFEYRKNREAFLVWLEKMRQEEQTTNEHERGD